MCTTNMKEGCPRILLVIQRGIGRPYHERVWTINKHLVKFLSIFYSMIPISERKVNSLKFAPYSPLSLCISHDISAT